MTEPDGFDGPEMPRDPDMDVPSLDAYTFSPDAWAHPEYGMGYGVRAVFECADGSRLACSLDTPDAAEQVARDLMKAAAMARRMRWYAEHPPTPAGSLAAVPDEPDPEREAEVEAIVERRSVRLPEAGQPVVPMGQHSLDPKRCGGCGVVEGARFEWRHHPADCPALLAWQAEQQQAEEAGEG